MLFAALVAKLCVRSVVITFEGPIGELINRINVYHMNKNLLLKDVW